MKLLLSVLITATAWTAAAENIVYQDSSFNGVLTVRELAVQDLPISPAQSYSYFGYANDCTHQRPGASVMNVPPVTGDVQLDAILNIGSKVWSLVKENAPVVEIQLSTASALPQGIQCWNQLEQWQPLRAAYYEVAYTNAFGAEIIRYNFRLVYAYGGTYKGQGRYIANATVQNEDVWVLMTNRFDVNVQIPQVLNVGTIENPVAAMQITVNWRVRNILIPFADQSKSVSFEIRGDGAPIRVL